VRFVLCCTETSINGDARGRVVEEERSAVEEELCAVVSPLGVLVLRSPAKLWARLPQNQAKQTDGVTTEDSRTAWLEDAIAGSVAPIASEPAWATPGDLPPPPRRKGRDRKRHAPRHARAWP
jgi:hypothetical protein